MSRLSEEKLTQLVSAVFLRDEAAGTEVLVQLDFARPDAAFGDCARILEPLGPSPKAEQLASILLDTVVESSDPDMALANWERLFDASFSRSTLASLITEDPRRAEYLSRLFGHSQFLADLLVLNPEYVDWLDSPAVHSDKSLAVYDREMARRMSLLHEDATLRDALCRYHRRELLRIGLRDLMGWAPLEVVVAEISDLAAATVRAALTICSNRLQARYGVPLQGDGPERSGFAVIAMGKLGGRELNYSSDIDLVFVFEAPGTTSGIEDLTGRSTGAISNQEYFSKLGSALIDFLCRHGPEGRLYRVDMRLRPEGKSGALVPSFHACTNYYLGRARLWERIALVKARGIAGDPVLIEQFERMAEGFVYAATTPAELLAEVARLKDRIDRDVTVSDESDREIKRGRGGLREIEFIVATLQILHGETQPRLRVRSTLATLQALRDERILAPDDARRLESAYRFYRRAEHALQCMAWRQTHTIPAEEHERAALAVRCGLRGRSRTESAARFETARRRFAESVHRFFDEMFRTSTEESRGEDASPLRLLDTDCSPEEAAGLLAAWRFRDPAIVEPLRRVARGTANLFISPAGQRRFEEILPSFLESAGRVPWPEDAVRHFEAFVQACGNAAGYYQLLGENRSILDLLLRLFGTSGHLSRRLIANPGWFELLVRPETFEITPDQLREAGRELATRTDRSTDCRLRALREYAFLNALRIGLHYILGLASARDTARTLSALADACIETATTWTIEEILAGKGISQEDRPPFAILALGKLGRRELIFLSDLDVVFVSDTNGPWAARHGTDATSLFAHMAERFIFYLTDPGAGGAAFSVDARLRPEGRNAPLVSSLERFRRHFQGVPEVWEIQTYLGGRVVAGDRGLGEQALDVVAGAIERLGDEATVATAVRSMRHRLEETVRVPAWALADFKRGPGGLVDAEFVAQYLQILHARRRPELVNLAPLDVFAVAARSAWIDCAVAAQLAEDYDYLRRLETDVRLLFESRQTCFPSETTRVEALLYAPGRSACPPEDMREAFEQCTIRMRQAFDRVLNA